MAAFAAACGSSSPSSGVPSIVLVPGPSSNPLPDPTPAPSCVNGALVSRAQVCGLGVAGPAYHWNDAKMREDVRRRAAENLAGMLRSVVTTALVAEKREDDSGWSREERYLEIDDALVDRVASESESEVWFDVLGDGPFRKKHFTYACACMDARAAGLEVDVEQARAHAFERQYAADEVPPWVDDYDMHNGALRCALGYQDAMFFRDDYHAQLTESVRVQLVGKTRSWVMDGLDDQSVCKKGECTQYIDSLLAAANEGISRGVALTAVWFDKDGMGPNQRRASAYGWGCVFDRTALDAARQRLRELRQMRSVPVPVHPTEPTYGLLR